MLSSHRYLSLPREYSFTDHRVSFRRWWCNRHWPTVLRVWEDLTCTSVGKRVACDVYQCSLFCTHEQMVRRIEQACCSPLWSSTEVATLNHLHRWNRLLLEREGVGGSWGYWDDESRVGIGASLCIGCFMLTRRFDQVHDVSPELQSSSIHNWHLNAFLQVCGMVCWHNQIAFSSSGQPIDPWILILPSSAECRSVSRSAYLTQTSAGGF